jgi:hypothetical protein
MLLSGLKISCTVRFSVDDARDCVLFVIERDYLFATEKDYLDVLRYMRTTYNIDIGKYVDIDKYIRLAEKYDRVKIAEYLRNFE